MRLSGKLSIRKIGDEYIGLKTVESSDNIDVTNALGMNEVSYFIIQRMMEKDFTQDDILKLVTDNYDVSPEQAQKDISDLIEKLKSIHLIEM